MKGRHGQGKSSESSSVAIGEAILALARANKFSELEARLSTVGQLDVTSDAVLEAYFRCVQAQDIECIDRFFSLGIDPNTRWRENTALGGASRLGSAALIGALIDRGCDVSSLGRDDNTPVVDACASASQLRSISIRAQFEEAVALLLKRGADPNQPNMVHMTALDYACKTAVFGWVSLVRILLDGGARLECAFEKGCECLNSAAVLNSPELLQVLLEHGGNANCKNCMGATPLMVASVFGRDNNVKLLLEKGADVSLRDNEGLSASDHALKHDSGTVLPLLEAARGKRG